MKRRPAAPLFPRIVAVIVAGSQVLAPHVAQAASTDLADVPISEQNKADPNLLFSLDNSDSMGLAYILDEEFANTQPDKYKSFRSRNCFKNAFFNKIYYDPTKVYRPAKSADGYAMPDANFYAAYPDAFNKNAGYADAGAGIYHGDPYFAYERSAPSKTGPINLATNFQAVFSPGGADLDTNYRHFDTIQPAYYYMYTGNQADVADKSTCFDDTSYRKVVVSTTSGPGGSDERSNFANWFSYYRIRLQVMKTALSRTFANVDSHYRVGFTTINDLAGNVNSSDDNFVPIDNFEGAHRNNWYARMFSVTSRGGTPLAESVRRAGEYYKSGKFPGSALAYADPVQQACQRNYLILSTDGTATDATTAPFGNYDRVVPTLPAPIPLDPIANAPLVPGKPFPPPFYEGATASSDSIADVSMFYWATNLRPAMAFRVPTTLLDAATWQHMNMIAIGLGVSGDLPFSRKTYDELVKGSQQWPTPVLRTSSEIDDLWHAAVSGHGKYFNANSGTSLETALSSSLAEIVSGGGAGSAVTVSNPNVSATDNLAFEASYVSGSWSGDLKALRIDPATGLVDPSLPVWKSSAQAQLDARDWTTRNIATYSGKSGVPFTAAALTATQRARLNTPGGAPGPSDANNLINFLRGDLSREDFDYRVRLHRLGDIVNADPLFVGPPSASYSDTGYGAFRAQQASRPKMIYQGANDGMLHAFNATTGAEQWAYVPGLLINEPYVFKSPAINYPGTSALVNLSRQPGFTHRFYVDGTPVVADIDLAKTQGATGAPAWISLLVGGLNKGGRGYYALDVTSPGTVTSDAIAASRVKWEFPNSATSANVGKNVGNSFGKPVTVKTAAAGWVTLVSSGYNNGVDTGGDGQGHLFVLNAANGNLIADLRTGAGDSATPSGLAQLSAYVRFGNIDSSTDYVYGGDLLGNMWRFDLSGATTSSWNVKKLATLVDAGGRAQPITTAPELANVGAVRTVYVGTGQYFGLSDLPTSPGANAAASQGQTLYGLVDNLSATPTIAPLRSNLVAQTLRVSGTTAVASSNEVDLIGRKGWYIDLPVKGERSVSSPSVALGSVSFATNIPVTEICGAGGSSWLYVLDYKTGGFINDPNVSWSGTFIANSLASRPTLSRLKSGKIVQLIRTSDAKTVAIVPPVPQKVYKGRRTLWKEIVTD